MGIIKIVGIGGFGADFYRRLDKELLKKCKFILFDTQYHQVEERENFEKVVVKYEDIESRAFTDILFKKFMPRDGTYTTLSILVANLGDKTGKALTLQTADLLAEFLRPNVALLTLPCSSEEQKVAKLLERDVNYMKISDNDEIKESYPDIVKQIVDRYSDKDCLSDVGMEDIGKNIMKAQGKDSH
jgi:cell division GTPase FtsZ